MDRNDGRHRATGAPAHDTARPPVERALLLQIEGQCLRIHRVRALVDVDEIRARPHLRDRLGGGDEGQRDRHDSVPGLNACREQHKP